MEVGSVTDKILTSVFPLTAFILVAMSHRVDRLVGVFAKFQSGS